MNKQTNFHLLSVKKHSYKPHTLIKAHSIKTIAICYIISGAGTVSINNTIYKIKAGTCLFLEPTMLFQLKTVKEPVQLFYLMYSKENMNDIYNGNEVITVNSQVLITNLFIQLDQVTKKESFLHLLKRQSLFYELLYSLGQEIKSKQAKKQTTIDKMIKYMDDHFDSIEDIGQLPYMAGLTPSSFCRAFKNRTGQTPGSYITELRMKRAKELLTVSNESIKEVSYAIGYQDPLYFSRVFKKSIGVSPSLYVKNKNKRIAVVSGLFLQDQLISLGITPIAAPSLPTYFATKSGYPSYLEEHLIHSTPLNMEEKIKCDELKKLSPDLLLCMDTRNGNYDYLQTTSNNTFFLNDLENWKDYQLQIARKLEKEAIAERVIERIEQFEKSAKTKLRTFTRKGKWAIIRIFNNEIRLYGNSGHALSYLYYHDLAFQPIDNLNHSAYKVVSLEDLVTLNPERIMIIWTETKEIHQLINTPIWKELRAAHEHEIYIPDSKEWDPWGPYGREHMIKKSVEYFSQFI